MDDCDGLENRWALAGPGGSNPPPSAMPVRHGLKRGRLLAALAVIALVAVGCGGDEAEDATTSGTAAGEPGDIATSPSTTAEAGPPTTTTTEPPTTTTEPSTTTAHAPPTTTEAPATTTTATEAPPSTTTTVPTTVSVPGSDWVAFNGGEDCQCADGSDYFYWVREADPERVVFYLQGGGACFTRDSCAFTGETNTYDVTADPDEPGDNPAMWGGIFDFDNPLNPLRDHSFVVALYCTGDVHLGNRTNDYGDGVVVNHNGFVNANTALATAVERFGDATEVVVAGSSAGSAGAPLFGGLAADAFGDANITVVADASGAYPSDPTINAYVGSLWGTLSVVPDWPVNEGMTAGEWGLPELFVQAGLHAPRIRFARFDNAFDSSQAFYASLVGFDTSTMDQLMHQNEAMVEAAGVNQASYMAPGTDHTILFRDLLYTLEVADVAFVDWLTAVLQGDDVDDVTCVDCS